MSPVFHYIVAQDETIANLEEKDLLMRTTSMYRVEIIEKNTPKIRYEVGKRIRLRLTPELKFVYTDSLEKGSRVSELIDKISKGEI